MEDIDKEIEKIEDKQNSQDKEVHESNKIAPEVWKNESCKLSGQTYQDLFRHKLHFIDNK